MINKTTAERNPYSLPNSEPRLHQSIVAFIDILGFKHLVLDAKDKSEKNNTDDLQELFKKFYESLSSCWFEQQENWSEEMYSWPFVGGKKDSYKFRIFSDSVLIGCPIKQDTELDNINDVNDGKKYHIGLDFLRILSDISLFQSQLTEHGFFTRGAITVGDLYMDDSIIFGSAVIEAYDAEQNEAKYPRIILSRSATDYYGNLINRITDKHRKKILEDEKNKWLFIAEDGKTSINYLESIHIGDHPFFDILENHKNRIEENIKKNMSDKHILKKYLWSAYYHNKFCNKYAYQNYQVAK